MRNDLISRQAAIDICANAIDLWRGQFGEGALIAVRDKIKELPPAQPEQLEQCPIYGGMCAYPSDQCYDCPRHAGRKDGGDNMKSSTYYMGNGHSKWGIWNKVQKQFQFGICEDTPMLAEARLFQKIGEDAKKWKFEVREVTT